MAYSPEESAALRSELSALSPPQPAAPGQSAEPSAESSTVLVTLTKRDEDPSAGSPLSYRERSFYWPPPVVRSEVERALQDELARIQHTLQGAPRGKYVNLAVFDHVFRDKPEAGPLATLQWKDWRGEPVLSWSEEPQGHDWLAAPVGAPVRSSFAPQAGSHPPAAVALPKAPSSPAWPAAAPVPSPAASAPQPFGPPGVPASPVSPVTPFVPQPAAPVAPVAAPVAPAAVWPPPVVSGPGNPVPRAMVETPVRPNPRDATGDQDRRLAIAFEAAQDLYFLATPADGLDFAVKLLQELVPAEAISGCIYDINTDEFRFVAVSGVGATERKAKAVPSTTGLFSVAVRSGRDSLIIPDVLNEPRFEPEVDGRTGLVVNDIAYVLLHKADQLFGMLQLINRKSPRGFSESDMAVASYVADQVTQFLREKRGLGRK